MQKDVESGLTHGVRTVVMKNYTMVNQCYFRESILTHLRAVRVRASIRHRQKTRAVMLQVEVLVLELVAVN